MTRNQVVFGVTFLVTAVVALSPFFSNKPALADSGSDVFWENKPPKPPTILKFCNNTNLRLIVAYVRNAGNKGWLAKGWEKVNSKSCRSVKEDISQADIVFLYAENEKGGIYSQADAYFCVDRVNAFLFANADTKNCNGGSLKKVGTIRWKVGPGTNTFNFN